MLLCFCGFGGDCSTPPECYKIVNKKILPKDKQIGGEHYKNMKIQPSEFIVANELGWYEGNAVKYICRHRQKGGKQDLEKAIHYLELALEEYDG